VKKLKGSKVSPKISLKDMAFHLES
jgi:hypothetical protein